MQFGEDGLIARAGGYRVVAPQAWPIMLSALRAEPGAMLANALRNAAWQFFSFQTGDGLIMPMPALLKDWQDRLPAGRGGPLPGEQAVPPRAFPAGLAAGACISASPA